MASKKFKISRPSFENAHNEAKFQRGDMQNKLRYELLLHMLSTYLISTFVNIQNRKFYSGTKKFCIDESAGTKTKI